MKTLLTPLLIILSLSVFAQKVKPQTNVPVVEKDSTVQKPINAVQLSKISEIDRQINQLLALKVEHIEMATGIRAEDMDPDPKKTGFLDVEKPTPEVAALFQVTFKKKK